MEQKMRKIQLTCSLAFIGVCAPVYGARANEALPVDSIVLQGVVVQGKHANNPVTTTAPVRSISQQDIQTQGITDIADAMRRMAGVTLRDYGGAGGLKSVSVRGMGAQHTAVSYDGVLLNDAQNGMIDLSRYSLDNLSALTLYIGDNADIFMPARNAASASRLDISTVRPLLQDALEAKLKVGSFGYVSPSARWEKLFSEKFSTTLMGEYLRADNHYPYDVVNGKLTHREKRSNSDLDNGHLEANALWRPARGQEITAKLYFYKNAANLPGAVDLYETSNNERQKDCNLFAQVRYRGRLSNLFSLLGNVKWNWTESLYKDVKGSYSGGVNRQNYWQREYYASAALLCIPVEGLSAVYAVDYFYNNLNSNGILVGRPTRDSYLQSLSVKYTHRYAVLMGRALYSKYTNGLEGVDASATAVDIAKQSMARNIDRLSPSFSLAVYPMGDGHLSLRTSYKEIFRLPTFTENYCGRYMGSTVLKPENTRQWNVGVGYTSALSSWLPNLTVSVDYYTNHVSDKIVALPITTYIWQYLNVGKVRTNGVDVSLQATFHAAETHQLVLTANYSYQNAENRTNPLASTYKTQIAYIPKNSGAWSLTWENPWCNVVWHATASGERWSTNGENSNTHIDGYTDMGLTLYRDIRWGDKTVNLRGDIMNLFDKQYEVVRRYPMPGRAFKFTIGIKL
jgi:hypothetical protein